MDDERTADEGEEEKWRAAPPAAAINAIPTTATPLIKSAPSANPIEILPLSR